MEFEVLTPVVMEVAIFWDIVLYSLYMNQRFGGIYHVHLQGLKSTEQEIRTCYIPEDANFLYSFVMTRVSKDSYRPVVIP